MLLRSHGKVLVAQAALLVGLMAIAAGCTDIVNLLNPSFLQALGAGDAAATIPGEAPSLLVEVDNGTQNNIEFRVTWRDADGDIQERIDVLIPGQKYAEALICPISEITLGDVGNLESIGAVVRLGSGSANDAIVEVEAFGVLLQEEVNYDCGESITFTILPSSATASGYQAFAYIRQVAD